MAAKKATKRAARGAKRPAKKPVKKAQAKKSTAYGKRRDFGGPIESYISTLVGDQRAIAERLRAIIKKVAPGAEEQLKWGMPVYSKGGLLCYFRAFGGHVSFGFYDHRDALDDPRRVLDGAGKGAHVKLRHLDEIDQPRIETWIRAVSARNAAR